MHTVNTEIERIGAINNPGRCWAGGKCPTNKSIASFEDSFQMKVPVSVPPFFVDLRHAMRSTKIDHVTFHPPSPHAGSSRILQPGNCSQLLSGGGSGLAETEAGFIPGGTLRCA